MRGLAILLVLWHHVYMQPARGLLGVAYQLTYRIVLRGGWGTYMINPNNDWNRPEGFDISTSVINSNDGGRTPILNLLNNPFPQGILKPPGKSLGLATLLAALVFFNLI